MKGLSILTIAALLLAASAGAEQATVQEGAMDTDAAQDDPGGELFGVGSDLSGFLGSDPAALSYLRPDPQFAEVRAKLPPGSVPPLIGIIDSGVNPDHPQLKPYLRGARAFAGDDPDDRLGHGTAVAIVAVAASQAPFLSARVTDDDHVPRLKAVLKAIDWMAENDVRIVNLSLGFAPDAWRVSRLCRKLDALSKSHPMMMFFIAAGNSPASGRPVPASCDAGNAMVVGSPEPTSGPADILAPLPAGMGYGDFLYASALERLDAAGDAAGDGAGDGAGDRSAARQGLADLMDWAGRDGSAHAHQLVGLLASRLDEAVIAFDAFGHQAKADPTTPWPRYNRAVILFRSSHVEDAAAEIALALALDPDMPRALWLDAMIRGNTGDRAGLVAALDRLRAADPSHPHAGPLRDRLEQDDQPTDTVLKRYFEDSAHGTE
jgi:hypothetical protein